MTKLYMLSGHTYAGHYQSGGSNKDWAAALAVESETTPGDGNVTSGAAGELVYLSVFGPHGANLRQVPPKRMSALAARKLFESKVNEKRGEGYQGVPFAPFLPSFGSPLGLELVPPADIVGMSESVAARPLASARPATLGYAASVVKAVSRERFLELLASREYVATEKVNGERCLLHYDGRDHLTAYNRKGQQMSAPPEGAKYLKDISRAFVIDGERMTRDAAGLYVAFALLELGGQNLTHGKTYQESIEQLHWQMYTAGLLREHRLTPTLADALANSEHANLALLAGEPHLMSRHIFSVVESAGGEGVIARALHGNYNAPLYKYKFMADLDAFVISINEGMATGSLKMGIVRRSDRAIIEVANVRSGLTDADIERVRLMLQAGQRPVFSVTYLPIRTVGVLLVEPRTSMAQMRSDKDAAECTDEQYEPEKALLVAQARPVSGVKLL